LTTGAHLARGSGRALSKRDFAQSPASQAEARSGREKAVSGSRDGVELRHGDECDCVRCRGFDQANTLSVRHAAYAVVHLGPRAAEIADELRELVPGYSVIDEPALRTTALVLARLEVATAALDAVDASSEDRPLAQYTVEEAAKLQRLREDTRGWVNTARRLFNDLGLTTTSRAKLGLDIVQTEHTLERLKAEGREIRKRMEQS
jgi:hypothetical protein